MKEITEPEMLHRAAAYCSAAERCIQDVQKKIDAAGLPPDASERIIARLLKERFIDESRYTRFFVNDKLRFCRRHGIICSTCFSQTYVKYVNDHSSREKNKFA